MCFGGDDGSDEAKRARQEETQRQNKIRAGTSRINSIFDGGSPLVDAGSITSNFSKKAVRSGKDTRQYFDEKGNPIGAGYQGKIYAKEAPIAGSFTPEFFAGRRKAYMDYATPQLEDQYGDAQKQLIFSLDRSGNLDSTARGEKMGELQKLYDIQKQQVADRALTSETQARNAVEDARSNLIMTLNATGDAEGAAKSAIARAGALSAPEEFSPLSQLFVDFTNGLGIQAAQERSYAAGGPSPRYNTGLFGNAGRVSVS